MGRHAHQAGHRTLAVDPHIHRIGYANFNGDLLDFGTQTPRKGDPVTRIHVQIIPTLILLLDRFKPDVLLVPKVGTGRTRRSRHVGPALEALAAEAWRRGIAVHAFSDQEVLHAFRDTEGRAARKKAAIDRLLAERYPDLERYLPPRRRNYDNEAYYRPLFNAVALYGAYEDLEHRDT